MIHHADKAPISITAVGGTVGRGVRSSYLCFPGWSQPLWTWLTGKALPHEEPPVEMSAVIGAAASIAVLFVSIACHVLVLESDLPLAVQCAASLVFFVITTGRLRSMQVVYLHHATHGSIFPGSRRGNRWAANIFSTIALIQSPVDYRGEHLPHHRRSVFTTLEDADAALLYRFGLRPGLSVAKLRSALLRAIFSPAFHVYFASARLRSNWSRSVGWRLLCLVWAAFLFVGLPLLVHPATAAIAVWLPLIFGYQASALLQFATEHQWLLTEQAPSDFHAYVARCHGRFCGEATPGGGSDHLLAWPRWWARTVFMHVPLRLAVLVGDLPAHDWHHLCGILKDDPDEWPSAIWARQRAIDEGRSWGMEDRETWGLSAMLDHVFKAMAQAPKFGPVVADSPEAVASAASPRAAAGGHT